MSNWCSSHPWLTAMLKTIQTVVGFTTELKVSWKSTPGLWWNPLATKWALYLSTEPLEFLFIRKTHLHPTRLWCGDSETRSRVSFLTKALNSSDIDCLYLESFNTWITVVGSISSVVASWVRRFILQIGLLIFFLDLVTMVWAGGFDGSRVVIVVCWDAQGCIWGASAADDIMSGGVVVEIGICRGGGNQVAIVFDWFMDSYGF